MQLYIKQSSHKSAILFEGVSIQKKVWETVLPADDVWISEINLMPVLYPKSFVPTVEIYFYEISLPKEFKRRLKKVKIKMNKSSVVCIELNFWTFKF